MSSTNCGVPRKAWISAFAFFVAGLLLRLYGLDRESLWFDELYTWRFGSEEFLRDAIEKGVVRDVHPPGYVVFWHWWIHFAGDSAWAMRLPSAVAGTLAIPAMIWLALTLYSWREAWFCAGLMAFSWAPLHYSQEARAYSFVLLLCILAMGFMVHVVRDLCAHRTPRLLPCVAYCTCTIALVYMHYFGWLFVAALVVGGWLWLRRSRGSISVLLLLQVPLVLSYAPWMPTMFRQWRSHQEFWIGETDPADPLKLLTYFFSKSSPIMYLAVALYGWLWIRWYTSRRKGRPMVQRGTGIVVSCLLLPVIATFVYSQFMQSLWTRRYLLICLPAAFLLMARGIRTLRVCRPWLPGAASLAVLLIGAANVFWLMHYFTEPHKQQWREATALILRHSPPPSRPIVVVWSVPPFGLEYYAHLEGEKLACVRVASLNELAEAIRASAPAGVWFLSLDALESAQVSQFLEEQGLVSVREENLRGISLKLLCAGGR